MKPVLLNNDLLSLPCEEVGIEEGNEIAQVLLDSLPEHGVGIAANQIGIQKNVCLVNVNKPIVFINPNLGFINVFLEFIFIADLSLSVPLLLCE